jgi:hypothetical protein
MEYYLMKTLFFIIAFLMSFSAMATYDPTTLKVPGGSNSKVCRFSWGGAGGSLAGPTACTSSPCTTYLDSCSALTGTITRTGAGDYNRDSNGWVANTPVSCFSQSSGGDLSYPVVVYAADGSGVFNIRARHGKGTLGDASVMMTCIGRR